MEKFNINNELINREIEKKANYEGDHTVLFFERLENPDIKKRLIDNLFDHSQESPDKEDRLSREEIAKNLEKDILYARRKTHIKFVDSVPSVAVGRVEAVRHKDFCFRHAIVSTGAINPATNEKYSIKTLNIIESHEKGHQVRMFLNHNSKFSEHVRSGFDFNKDIISKDYINFIREYIIAENGNEEADVLSDEDIINQALDYQSRINELFERMSQLKNYFGIKDLEIFTKDHLRYAKKYYSRDTGLVKEQMQPFFDAITPEKEDRFIELMNTLGI